MIPTLLVVDDDPAWIRSCRMACAEAGLLLQAAGGPASALSWLQRSAVTPALAGLRLEGDSYRGEECFRLVRQLRDVHPAARVVVYCPSHRPPPPVLASAGIQVWPLEGRSARSLIDAGADVAAPVSDDLLDGIILGRSPACASLKERVRRYAASPFPVLIVGASGSGKEQAAHGLHRLSARAGKPMLIVNCAALTASLFESQLFGHVRGAFTGAVSSRSGYFEDAADGTLLLDEIGELGLDVQAKLLRVLENGEYTRVGETRPRRIRARLLAATNQDLPALVESGRFRRDLYHRLAVLVLRVPDLAERPSDKGMLWRHYTEKIALELDVDTCRFTPAAMALWMGYDFPGNVRELKNLIIRLLSRYPGQTVDEHELLQEIRCDAWDDRGDPSPWARLARELMNRPGFELEAVLRQFEERCIRDALERAEHNLSAAARLLGLSRTTLYGRLERLGIPRPAVS